MVAGKQATNKQKAAYKRLGLSHMQVARGMQEDSQKGTILKVLGSISKLSKVRTSCNTSSSFWKRIYWCNFTFIN